MSTLFDVLEEERLEREREAEALAAIGRGAKTPAERHAEREATIQERFAAFHAAHPEVYAELVELARTARRAGRSRIGIGMLWEVLRWERTLRGVEEGGFKLNDHFRSRYARLLMEREPDLAGIFETRELRS